MEGLQVMDHYGNFNMTNFTDVELAGIDEDKAIAVSLKHDGKLEDEKGVSFQAALLYTTKDGHRRVRVHNLNMPITEHIADVFRHGDHEAIVSFLAKKGQYWHVELLIFDDRFGINLTPLTRCSHVRRASHSKERNQRKAFRNVCQSIICIPCQLCIFHFAWPAHPSRSIQTVACVYGSAITIESPSWR